MIRRVSHLTLALLVAAAVATPVALAGGGKSKKHHGHSGCVSAVCVYTEGGGPSLSGSHGGTGPAVKLSSAVARKLARLGGKDAQALAEIATSRAFGVQPPKPGAAASVGHVTAPGAFLAALDLGAGPISLFVVLLAGAAAFGLGAALRRRRSGA